MKTKKTNHFKRVCLGIGTCLFVISLTTEANAKNSETLISYLKRKYLASSVQVWDKKGKEFELHTVSEINVGSKKYSVTLENGDKAKIEFLAESKIIYGKPRPCIKMNSQELAMKPLEVAQIVNNGIKAIGVDGAKIEQGNSGINLQEYVKNYKTEEDLFTGGEEIIYTDVKSGEQRSGAAFVQQTDRGSEVVLENCVPVTIKFKEH